jgi:hypothetical protein
VPEYNETKPLAELIALKARLSLVQDAFTDADGNVLDLGYPVRYIHDRTTDQEIEDGVGTVWNPERWGIVTGLVYTPKFDYEARTESDTEFDVAVRVTTPNIITSREQSWRQDEWTADVKSVRVIQ